MNDIQWFNTAATDPQVILLPTGARATHPDGRIAVLTKRAVWFRLPQGVARVALGGSTALQLLPSGFLVTSDTGRQVWLRSDNQPAIVEDIGARAGRDICIARVAGGPWTCDQMALSAGAGWSATTRPWPIGMGVAWCADGYVYRQGSRAQPVSRASPFSVGPHGAMLLGQPFEYVVPAGAARRPLTTPVFSPLVWNADGQTVCATAEDGTPVVVHVATGMVRADAIGDTLNAFTCAVSAGMVTVDEDGHGHWVKMSGEAGDAVHCPLDADCNITEAMQGGLKDSNGRYWQLSAEGFEPTPSLPPATRTRVAGQRLIGSQRFGDAHIGWSSAGLLLSWT